jgi:hypothetical protein
MFDPSGAGYDFILKIFDLSEVEASWILLKMFDPSHVMIPLKIFDLSEVEVFLDNSSGESNILPRFCPSRATDVFMLIF